MDYGKLISLRADILKAWGLLENEEKMKRQKIECCMDVAKVIRKWMRLGKDSTGGKARIDESTTTAHTRTSSEAKARKARHTSLLL